MKFRIVNRTVYPTKQLRSFVVRAYRVAAKAAGPRVVAEYERRFAKLEIIFARSNRRSGGYSTGHAYLVSSICHVGIHDNPHKPDVARVIVHEIGHCFGLNHSDMAGSAIWMRDWKAGGTRSDSIYAWANDLPLCPKPSKAKPTIDQRRAGELARIEAGIRRWQTKAKRAENALRKLQAKRKRITKLISQPNGDTPCSQ